MITVVRATAKGKFSIANIKKQTSYKWHSLLFLLSVKWEINIFKDINRTTVIFQVYGHNGGIYHISCYLTESLCRIIRRSVPGKSILYTCISNILNSFFSLKIGPFFLMIYIVFVEVYFKSFQTCALFLCFSISVCELQNF